MRHTPVDAASLVAAFHRGYSHQLTLHAPSTPSSYEAAHEEPRIVEIVKEEVDSQPPPKRRRVQQSQRRSTTMVPYAQRSTTMVPFDTRRRRHGLTLWNRHQPTPQVVVHFGFGAQSGHARPPVLAQTVVGGPHIIHGQHAPAGLQMATVPAGACWP